MYYVMGDIHGNFTDVTNFIKKYELNEQDCVILLGDVGFNFYGPSQGDIKAKKKVNNFGVKIFCIQGNHECRPQNLPTYKEMVWNKGQVYYEPTFQNILFAADGEIYDLNGKKALVVGGAYSVDKYYRLCRYMPLHPELSSPELYEEMLNYIKYGINNGEIKHKMDQLIESLDGFDIKWWKDEQPSEDAKLQAEINLTLSNWNVDFVFSHTCPYKYIPAEAFISGLNQNSVDNSTELWLDSIEDKLNYSKWYCGHWHIQKVIDKINFLNNTPKELQ